MAKPLARHSSGPLPPSRRIRHPAPVFLRVAGGHELEYETFPFSVDHHAPSAAAGNLEKFLPAGNAEIPDRVESIPFESLTDLFDRHVGPGIEVDDLADASF